MKTSLALAATALAMTVVTGCSNERRTVRTTETVRPSVQQPQTDTTVIEQKRSYQRVEED